jgi:hypothetical protein
MLCSSVQDSCKSGGTGTITRTRASDVLYSTLGGVWSVFCRRVSAENSPKTNVLSTETHCRATVRIAGSALVLASSHPDKPMLIAASSLQSVGLSPLLFEVSLVMLRWYV